MHGLKWTIFDVVISKDLNVFVRLQEEMDRKEKMTAGLNQTVRELQQLLQAVNRQLTKGQEEVQHHIVVL